MPKKYNACMVFGIYDKIEDRHAALLEKANELCDKLYVAVSSDQEVRAVTGKPATVPLHARMRTVADFCRESGIHARVVGEPAASPAAIAARFCPNAYIVSQGQYRRFGSELKRIIKDFDFNAAIEVVKV